MKNIIAAFAAAFITVCLFGQQIEVFYGSHLMKGNFNEFAKGELTKITFGIAGKNIYHSWGLYFNWYSSKKKIYGDTIVIHQPSPFNTNVFDSVVYELKYMPYGYTAGISYSFENRLSVFSGAGMAIFRRKHLTYDNTYMPTSSGYYTEVFDSDYSDRIYEYQRKLCFEIGADYDFIKNLNWSLGVRAGFNTSTLFFGQGYIGYNFNKKE